MQYLLDHSIFALGVYAAGIATGPLVKAAWTRIKGIGEADIAKIKAAVASDIQVQIDQLAKKIEALQNATKAS